MLGKVKLQNGPFLHQTNIFSLGLFHTTVHTFEGQILDRQLNMVDLCIIMQQDAPGDQYLPMF